MPSDTVGTVVSPASSTGGFGSEPYEADNLLDRLSPRSALEAHYEHMRRRERELVGRRLSLRGGDVLSVGAGWHPGRHLFPAPAFRITAVDADPERVAGVGHSGAAEATLLGYAGELELPPASFDVVLYRLVLHHLAFQGPLMPIFTEAARLLRPGGALVAVEPGAWHPVGAGLTLANRAGVAVKIHGTPDDIPLSPTELTQAAQRAGLQPELHAVTFTWRRMPERVQHVLRGLDRLGSRPRAAKLGHTLLLIARRP